MPIRLVVGLGNPGERYAGTRHNVGFMLLDRAAEKIGRPDWKRWRSGEVLGSEPLYAKPATFMNESGRFVGELAAYRNIPPADVLVCYDDFALPLGRLRIRLKGSAGGHNGMRSLIAHLGTEEFPRLRVGIGPVSPGADPADFVLRKFKPEERTALQSALDLALEAVDVAVADGVEAAMNRFNKEPAA